MHSPAIIKGSEMMFGISRFSTPRGTEAFVTAEMTGGNNAGKDVIALWEDYTSFLEGQGLNAATEVSVRFHLRDIRSDARTLRRLLERREVPAFYSLIGQPPAGGGSLAIEAYHINSAGPVVKSKVSENELILRHGGYTSLWIRSGAAGKGRCGLQTREMFESLSGQLEAKGATVKESVIRTWCYIKNIQKNYGGFVRARGEFFSSLGMSGATHTVASTGIGATNYAGSLVAMDSLSVMGLDALQKEHMSVPEYMSPPYAYDVTFERGGEY
jgi:hypothetical protein